MIKHGNHSGIKVTLLQYKNGVEDVNLEIAGSSWTGHNLTYRNIQKY